MMLTKTFQDLQKAIEEEREYYTSRLVKLEKENDELKSIFDKIRTEIEELDTYYVNDFYIGNTDAMIKRDYVLHILDTWRDSRHVESS